MVRVALLLAVLLGAATATAGYVFRWVDTKGNLHLTDRLADVPEPYRAMYEAQIRRLEEERARAKAKGKAAPPAAPRRTSRPAPRAGEGGGGPSIVEQEIARQKYWRDLVAQWRAQLASATAALEAIDRELAQARLNPILRTTPPVKAKIAAIEERRAEALAQVEAARTMLLETIPARARKEQVPPKWLM